MKKTITTLITMAAMLFAVSANAQKEFVYEFTSICGESYESYTQTLDEEAIAAEIGCPLADASAFAVQSDGSLDPNYKLGETDGWRNADGDWAGWGDATSQFYVKADFTRAEGQLYEIGCHPDHSGAHLTDVVNYTAQYAFVVGGKSENKSVLYNVVVAIAPEAADLDITGLLQCRG